MNEIVSIAVDLEAPVDDRVDSDLDAMLDSLAAYRSETLAGIQQYDEFLRADSRFWRALHRDARVYREVVGPYVPARDKPRSSDRSHTQPAGPGPGRWPHR